jgi:peptidoglycan/xylan/chitin deacetylase (PgdA/CDA1 family)
VRALRVSLLAAVCCCALTLPAAGAAAAPTVVSLEFDHAFSDAAQGVALAASHGMPVTLFAMSGRVGLPGYMTYAQLLTLQGQGDEIGGHTIDHPDLATLPPAAQQHEICPDRAALEAAGLDVTDFAYPYGDFGAATPGILRACGYESARIAGGLGPRGGCRRRCPAVETIAPRRVYATRTPSSIVDTDSLATLKGYVEAARRAGGGWLQLVFHHVCDRCDTYAVSEPTLAAFLSWLASRPAIRVETVRQVIETPFRPGSIRVRSGPGRVVAVRAAARCPRAPGTARCAAVSGVRPRVVIAGAGSTLAIAAPSPICALRLHLAHGSSRALRAGETRWRIHLPAHLSARTATLLARYPLGTARYRFLLTAIRRR